MKINLDTPITTDPENKKSIRLGMIFEAAIFNSQGLQDAKELYDKVNKKSEAELSVKELSEIQKAVESRFVSGVCWQVNEIINQEPENPQKEYEEKKNEQSK